MATASRTDTGDGSAAGRRLRWLLVAAMAVALAAQVHKRFQSDVGVDFYHLWGVGRAQALTGGELGAPYAEREGYEDALNRAADRSGDAALRAANQARRRIDPTGTPLFYLSFAWLPDDFSAAYGLHRILQHAALVAALVLIGARLGVGALDACLLAGVVAMSYNPFFSEVHVGNVNSLQLLFLVLLCGLAGKRAEGGAAGLLAPALAAFVLWKPSFALAAVTLAAGTWARGGRRELLRDLGLGALTAAGLVALSSAWLGSFAAWSDWAAYLFGDGRVADYAVEGGNASPVAFLDAYAGIGAPVASVALGVAALGSLAALLARRRAAAAGLLRDPLFLASAGVVATFAAMPLCWSHYFVLALVPCLWLLARHGSRAPAALAFLAALVYWGPALYVLALLERPDLRFLPAALAWIPLLAGLLVSVARSPHGPGPRGSGVASTA